MRNNSFNVTKELFIMDYVCIVIAATTFFSHSLLSKKKSLCELIRLGSGVSCKKETNRKQIDGVDKTCRVSSVNIFCIEASSWDVDDTQPMGQGH